MSNTRGAPSRVGFFFDTLRHFVYEAGRYVLEHIGLTSGYDFEKLKSRLDKQRFIEIDNDQTYSVEELIDRFGPAKAGNCLISLLNTQQPLIERVSNKDSFRGTSSIPALYIAERALELCEGEDLLKAAHLYIEEARKWLVPLYNEKNDKYSINTDIQPYIKKIKKLENLLKHDENNVSPAYHNEHQRLVQLLIQQGYLFGAAINNPDINCYYLAKEFFSLLSKILPSEEKIRALPWLIAIYIDCIKKSIKEGMVSEVKAQIINTHLFDIIREIRFIEEIKPGFLLENQNVFIRQGAHLPNHFLLISLAKLSKILSTELKANTYDKQTTQLVEEFNVQLTKMSLVLLRTKKITENKMRRVNKCLVDFLTAQDPRLQINFYITQDSSSTSQQGSATVHLKAEREGDFHLFNILLIAIFTVFKNNNEVTAAAVTPAIGALFNAIKIDFKVTEEGNLVLPAKFFHPEYSSLPHRIVVSVDHLIAFLKQVSPQTEENRNIGQEMWATLSTAEKKEFLIEKKKFEDVQNKDKLEKELNNLPKKMTIEMSEIEDKFDDLWNQERETEDYLYRLIRLVEDENQINKENEAKLKRKPIKKKAIETCTKYMKIMEDYFDQELKIIEMLARVSKNNTVKLKYKTSSEIHINEADAKETKEKDKILTLNEQGGKLKEKAKKLKECYTNLKSIIHDEFKKEYAAYERLALASLENNDLSIAANLIEPLKHFESDVIELGKKASLFLKTAKDKNFELCEAVHFVRNTLGYPKLTENEAKTQEIQQKMKDEKQKRKQRAEEEEEKSAKEREESHKQWQQEREHYKKEKAKTAKDQGDLLSSSKAKKSMNREVKRSEIDERDEKNDKFIQEKRDMILSVLRFNFRSDNISHLIVQRHALLGALASLAEYGKHIDGGRHVTEVAWIWAHFRNTLWKPHGWQDFGLFSELKDVNSIEQNVQVNKALKEMALKIVCYIENAHLRARVEKNTLDILDSNLFHQMVEYGKRIPSLRLTQAENEKRKEYAEKVKNKTASSDEVDDYKQLKKKVSSRTRMKKKQFESCLQVAQHYQRFRHHISDMKLDDKELELLNKILPVANAYNNLGVATVYLSNKQRNENQGHVLRGNAHRHGRLSWGEVGADVPGYFALIPMQKETDARDNPPSNVRVPSREDGRSVYASPSPILFSGSPTDTHQLKANPNSEKRSLSPQSCRMHTSFSRVD